MYIVYSFDSLFLNGHSLEVKRKKFCLTLQSVSTLVPTAGIAVLCVGSLTVTGFACAPLQLYTS